MPIRFSEALANQRREDTNRAVIAVQNEGMVLSLARGGANIGVAGEIATLPMQVWPDIDPITGESIEPTPPADVFRAGDIAGVNKVANGRGRDY